LGLVLSKCFLLSFSIALIVLLALPIEMLQN
jgi:hypothetical protein